MEERSDQVCVTSHFVPPLKTRKPLKASKREILSLFFHDHIESDSNTMESIYLP